MEQQTEPTGWVGWIYFAGIVMVVVGVLNATYGFIALVNDEWVVWGERGAVYLDVTQWGWVHLILGVLVALAGGGVLIGNIIGRTIGVVLAAIGMIVNFLAIPLYPLWSLVLVTLNLLVIWALVAHGREVKEA